MKSDLLFYLNLVKCMKSKHFKLNPYDPCGVNNIIEGYQITLVRVQPKMSPSISLSGMYQKSLFYAGIEPIRYIELICNF